MKRKDSTNHDIYGLEYINGETTKKSISRLQQNLDHAPIYINDNNHKSNGSKLWELQAYGCYPIVEGSQTTLY